MDILERIKNVIVKNLVETKLKLPLNPAGSGAKVGKGGHRKGDGGKTAGESPLARTSVNTSIAGPDSWVHKIGATNPRGKQQPEQSNKPKVSSGKGGNEDVPAIKLPRDLRGF